MIRPRPLNRRYELVDVLRPYVPTKACGRAIDEGRYIVLGGFTPTEGLPCFIVQVESRLGSKWILAIEVDDVKNCYRVKQLDEVPYSAWTGDPKRRHPVYDGDKPDIMERCRIMCKGAETYVKVKKEQRKTLADRCRELSQEYARDDSEPQDSL